MQLKINEIYIGMMLGAAVCFFACLFLIATKKWHGKYSIDTLDGVQKFHDSPTPRIGGIPILLGFVASFALISGNEKAMILMMIVSGLPAFFAGVLEDCTKKIGVRYRLFATMMSGAVAWWITGYSIIGVEVYGVDFALQWMPFSIAFTMIAVGGVANAVNIIDGFNGLASGFLMLGFFTIGLISSQVNDYDIFVVSLICLAITSGFFIVNFPFGKMFLGDGGAYFLGFQLAWLAVMLPIRNPAVSNWAMLLVCAYPVIEVLSSVCRKTRRDGHHPGRPDRVHLHMLIFNRLAKKIFVSKSAVIQNSLTSIFIWPFAIGSCVLAVIFYQDKSALMLSFIFLMACYNLIYLRLIRFGWKLIG